MSQLHPGRAVLVTGAASGIGRAAARRFAEEGARVCVADRNLAGAEETVGLIVANRGTAFACEVDISKAEDNERMVAETVARFGGLDVAFLNAGYHGPRLSFFDSSVEDFDTLIGINLRGCYLGLRSVGKHIRVGGAIVVTASAAGVTGHPHNPLYSAAKHGIVGLVRSAARAFAERGVRINVLCPGGVITPMNYPDGVADFHVPPDELSMPAFRGQAQAQHVAEFAVFLASHRAAFATGTAVLVDGGLSSSFISPA